MTAPTLSIVVPTYNRPELLQVLLMSICRDFDRWPDDLELVVLDNASEASTADVVKEFQSRGVPIGYERNSRNLGASGNLAKCFDAAKGRYLWHIGDDEVLYRGTASFVLRTCREQDFGLAHLSSVGFPMSRLSEQIERHCPAGVRYEVLDAPRMVRRANVFLTFISANIVQRHAILEAIPNFDTQGESGTDLPYLTWIYAALAVRARHLFIDAPLFGALVGNTGGYRLVDVFGRQLSEVSRRRLEPVVPGAARTMANAVILRLIPSELMAAPRGGDAGNQFITEDVHVALQSAFEHNIYYRLVVRHLVSSSSSARRAAHAAVRLFNRLNRLVGFRLL